MDVIQNIIDGTIDFEGQRITELLSTQILIFSGIIGWLIGFFLKDVTYTLYIGLGGTLFAALLVIPPWPTYNNHPLRWLPSSAASGKGEGDSEDEVEDKKGQ